MTAPRITPRNLEVLAALIRMVDAAGGRAPKLEDLGKAMEMNISAVHGHLMRLRAAGYIYWIPGAQRSIRIIRRPETAEA